MSFAVSGFEVVVGIDPQRQTERPKANRRCNKADQAHVKTSLSDSTDKGSACGRTYRPIGSAQRAVGDCMSVGFWGEKTVFMRPPDQGVALFLQII